jgi:hypothetical protein
MNNKTIIELNNEQVEFMSLCNKNYKQIKRLVDSGVFDLKGGRAILDFDTGGNIANIQKILTYHFVKQL